MSNKKTTPPLRGTPPAEGNDSPSLKGWQAKPDRVVPKLRFPEFRDAGEWEFIQLHELAKRCAKKNRDGEFKRVLTNSAEYGVVNQRDFFDKDIATQGNLESYYIVEKGDYVYNPRISTTAPVGPISKNNIITGVMSPLYTVFRFKNSDNDFYSFYFKSNGWHSYMRQASSTGARHDRMAIASDDFMAMPLPVASPEEQQKIADCLASLDDLITAQTQKLAALKTHKKGLMQQLFPSVGGVPEGQGDSPPLEGWQAKPDGVVKSRYTKNYQSLPYNPQLKERAKALWRAGNLSEVLLWNQLKRGQFKGLDFDRLKIIGNYLVDFYCAEKQAVLEVDGSSHDDKAEYDAQRDAVLMGLGLCVIHILDVDVKQNLAGVMDFFSRYPAFVDEVVA